MEPFLGQVTLDSFANAPSRRHVGIIIMPTANLTTTGIIIMPG